MLPRLLVGSGYPDLIRNTPGLIGYYRMQEPSGTVMRDQLVLVNGVYGGAPTFARGTPIEGGAAPMFNGTSQYATIAKDLSAYAQLSISCWLYWDAFSGNDDLLAEYGATYVAANGFIIDPNASNNAGVFFNFGMGNTAGSLSWVDQFVRPSAARWHHYLFTMNRATPVNTVCVDGVLMTGANFGTVVHNAGTYGNFGNTTLNVMCRNAASLFGAGRMSELAIFGGRILTQADAAMQYTVGMGR